MLSLQWIWYSNWYHNCAGIKKCVNCILLSTKKINIWTLRIGVMTNAIRNNDVNRRLILVNPFQQPQKHVRSAQIWKTMTTIMLWALWKCRCNWLYDVADLRLSNVLLEIWENLLTVVHGQYDNMHGSPRTMNRTRKKLLHLWKNLPLLTESTQGPQRHYQLLWTFSWISVNHGIVHQQIQHRLQSPIFGLRIIVHRCT